MPKKFDTEIRPSGPDKFYLKVFVKDLDKIEEIQNLLSGLNSTRTVNITESTSKYSPRLNLTVYPTKVYDINEVDDEVKIALQSYFEGRPADPEFTEEALSSISEKAYGQIIDYINLVGRNLEKSKDLRTSFDEERSRDYFLPFLNSISKKYNATGETFNKIGKTDILVQNDEGENIFIGECKLWRGQAQFSDAINQLLDRYVNWRDEKVSLIIFNKTVQNFSEVIERAKETMTNHSNFHSYDGARNNTSFSYTFKHPEDDNKKIKIELMLFNFT